MKQRIITFASAGQQSSHRHVYLFMNTILYWLYVKQQNFPFCCIITQLKIICSYYCWKCCNINCQTVFFIQGVNIVIILALFTIFIRWEKNWRYYQPSLHGGYQMLQKGCRQIWHCLSYKFFELNKKAFWQCQQSTVFGTMLALVVDKPISLDYIYNSFIRSQLSTFYVLFPFLILPDCKIYYFISGKLLNAFQSYYIPIQLQSFAQTIFYILGMVSTFLFTLITSVLACEFWFFLLYLTHFCKRKGCSAKCLLEDNSYEFSPSRYRLYELAILIILLSFIMAVIFLLQPQNQHLSISSLIIVLAQGQHTLWLQGCRLIGAGMIALHLLHISAFLRSVTSCYNMFSYRSYLYIILRFYSYHYVLNIYPMALQFIAMLRAVSHISSSCLRGLFLESDMGRLLRYILFFP